MKSVQDLVDEALKVVREVEVGDLASMQDWVLLDVREPEEFASGHPAGARNVPRGMLEVAVDHEHRKRDPSLGDRSLKLALICGSGVRSALAAKAMVEMGFDDPVSVRGGWTAYVASGLPVERG
ncbi:MAG: rhodanese-like domain-containing protein [Fimbriimonadaceae bacterium]